MKNTHRLLTGLVGAALSVGIVVSSAAAANAVVEAQAATVEASVAVAEPVAAAPVEAALIAPMALPGGAAWQVRGEAIFDRRALILPPDSTLTYADAAALLGVSSVADSAWGNGGVGGRTTFNGSGWSGGAGAWALISNPQRYGQLYVLWQ